MRKPRKADLSSDQRWTGPGLCLAAALLAGAVGCGGSSGAGASGIAADDPEEEAIAVEVGPVDRDSLSAIYSTSATLRADKRATVTARTRGVVRRLLVEEGDWVDKDQELAVLEDEEQRITRDQAVATFETKRREFERARALHEQGMLSDEQFETARRESVETGHAAELAELELSRTVIRATFGGRILTRHLDVGATVNDGTPVYDLADVSPLYADVQVPERQVTALEPGQTVRVSADPAGESIAARIERIAPAVDPATGTVKVTIAVPASPDLRPGGFVRVGIVTDTHEGTLVVRRSALISEGHRWHLFRIKPDGRKVELIEVTRGFEEDDRVEILSSVDAERALDVGDRVVVTGASSLSDDSTVEVMNASAGSAAGAGEREES